MPGSATDASSSSAGEAGAGKTTLVRPSARSSIREIRVLAGACDALSTPRPLGRCTTWRRNATRSLTTSPVAAQPVRGLRRPARRARRAADRPRDRGSPLGRRGDVRRPAAPRPQDGRTGASSIATYRDDGLHRDHPLRVLLGDLATAAVGRRRARAPFARSRSRSLPRGTTSTPATCTHAPPATRSSSPRSSRPAATGCRRRSGMPSSRARPRLSGAELEVLEAVSLALPRAEPWLLEAVLGEAVDRLEACIATGLVDGRRRRRRVPPRARARGRRGRDATDAPARVAAAHPRGSRRPTTGEVDAARLAHHAEAAGDVEAMLVFAQAAAAGPAGAGPTARRRPSMRARCASAARRSRRRSARTLLEGAIARLLPRGRPARGDRR